MGLKSLVLYFLFFIYIININFSIITETVTKLKDYEERGKEIATRLCSTDDGYCSDGEYPVMSPPVPQNIYIDNYSNKEYKEDDIRKRDNRIRDNIRKRNNIEAEILVYRYLERLKKGIIVLNKFKCSRYQYNKCDLDFDIKKTDIKKTDIKETDIKKTDIKKTDIKETDIKKTDIKKKNAPTVGNPRANVWTECDFLIITDEHFVVVEVKNTKIDGNVIDAFKKSLIPGVKVRKLIQSIYPQASVLLFTAFPNVSSQKFDQTKVTKAQTESIIFKEDFDNFAEWWQHNVPRNIPSQHNSEHEKVKHILLAISCTEVNIPDETRFSLVENVMKIDKELKEGAITLEQNFKIDKELQEGAVTLEQNFKMKKLKPKVKQSINPNLVKAPSDVSDFLGVKYVTKEQNDVFRSKENLLLINGPAGSGKTMLLAGKMLRLAKIDPGKKVVALTGPNSSNIYQSSCDRAGIICEVLLTDYSTTPSQMFELITKSYANVVIVNMSGVNIEVFTDTLSLLNNCNVIVDDIQRVFNNSRDDISKLLDTLEGLSADNIVLVALDLVQGYNYCLKDIVSLVVEKKMCSEHIMMTLEHTSRNTFEISNILSVIRREFVKYTADDYISPIRRGHYIHGPMTVLHVLEKYDDKCIRDILEKELSCGYTNDNIDYSHVAVIHNNCYTDVLESIDNKKYQIMCLEDCFSAEWPAVIVVHEMRVREPYDTSLATLYLAMSRARVKCSLLLFPAKGKRFKDCDDRYIQLLDKFKPHAHTMNY